MVTITNFFGNHGQFYPWLYGWSLACGLLSLWNLVMWSQMSNFSGKCWPWLKIVLSRPLAKYTNTNRHDNIFVKIYIHSDSCFSILPKGLNRSMCHFFIHGNSYFIFMAFCDMFCCHKWYKCILNQHTNHHGQQQSPLFIYGKPITHYLRKSWLVFFWMDVLVVQNEGQVLGQMIVRCWIWFMGLIIQSRAVLGGIHKQNSSAFTFKAHNQI